MLNRSGAFQSAMSADHVSVGVLSARLNWPSGALARITVNIVCRWNPSFADRSRRVPALLSRAPAVPFPTRDTRFCLHKPISVSRRAFASRSMRLKNLKATISQMPPVQFDSFPHLSLSPAYQLPRSSLTSELLRRLLAYAKIISFSSGRGSAWLEHLVRDQGVGGSNPLAPIYKALSHQLIAATVPTAVISASKAVWGILWGLPCSAATRSIAALTVSSSGWT